MQPFTGPDHADLIRLLIQVAILLFTARAFGQISRKLGQPAVVGEILAGIILGPSVLSSLVPALGAWIIPQTRAQASILEIVSLLGAMFLMLITGLETDLGLIRRHARTAFGVSFCGIILTFVAGFGLGQFLPSSLLGNPGERMVFALFLGTAMAISAIAVIGKILMDLDLMRRDIGQTLIAAGMSDDTIGWIVLSVVISLASGHVVTPGSVLQSAGTVLAFIVLSLTVGTWLMRKLLDFVLDEVTVRERFLSFLVVMMFTWGAISMALHLEAVLGAFVIGIVFGQLRRLPEDVHEKAEAVAIGIFAPVFFAVAGLKVNLRLLFQPRLIGIALVIIVVTIAAKGLGTYLGARLIGRTGHWYALSFSAGLNSRGAMDIIIATIGLSLGVFSTDMFSIVVLMAMTNSLIAPAALRWTLGHVKPGEEELARLEKEEHEEQSLVAGIHRVLLPIRLREKAQSTFSIESQLIERLAANRSIALTLLTVTKPGDRDKGVRFLKTISDRFSESELSRKTVVGSSPSELILDEVRKEYDLMVLGASEESKSKVLFNPMVDYLLRVSPCPTMVVRSPKLSDGWRGSRILVPTTGSSAARHAADLAFALASEDDHSVVILNVVQSQFQFKYRDSRADLMERQIGIAHHMVQNLEQHGTKRGVDTTGIVEVARDPEKVILDLARKEAIDLIILGTDLRPGSQRLFLGPKVERLLNNALCPVVIFNTG